MKKILVISVSAGEGHVSAAKAIEGAGRERTDVSVLHIDMMEYVSRSMRAVFVDAYRHLITHAPAVWKYIYEKTDSTERIEFVNNLTKLVSQLQAKKFLNFVRDFAPDYIICTHAFPAQVLRQSQGAPFNEIPIAMVLTDYGVHDYWLAVDANMFFVATEHMRQDMIAKGVQEEKICVTGIPIDSIYFEIKSVDTLKKKYHVLSNAPLVLLLAGGQGIVPSDDIVRRMEADRAHLPSLQIVAVAGKNDDLYGALRTLSEEIAYHHLYVVEWTEHIDEYMRIADVVITKAGGLTTSECMALGKPILVTNTVLGQEEENAKYAERMGYARIAQHETEIVILLSEMLKEKKQFLPQVESPAKKIVQHVINAME